MTDEGIIVENVEWPTPVTIPYPPLMTYGYEGDVIFPFKVFRATNADLSTISLKFSFLICADICIPEEAQLEIDLSTAKPSAMLEESIKQLPVTFITTNTIASSDAIRIKFQAPHSFSKAYFFPRETDLFSYTPEQELSQIDEQTFQILVPSLTSDVGNVSGILSLDGRGYQVQETF